MVLIKNLNRLTPLYAIILGVTTLVPTIIYWPKVIVYDEHDCLSTWWQQLLYSNLFKKLKNIYIANILKVTDKIS